MKAVVIILGVLTAASAVHGQGLLAIGQKSDYKENVPLTLNVTALGGYDHIDYKDATSGHPNVSSYFVEGGLALNYAQNDRVTKFTSGAQFSTIHYSDPVENGKQTFYNARLDLGLQHAFSRRLTVSDNLYAAYEIEPNYSIGISDARRSGQYFYGYNNFAVSYAWSERFATTSSYTFSGIKYQDDTYGRLENRMIHTFAQQFAYKISRTTALTAEYRYEVANYTDYPGGSGLPKPDYRSHYLLAGVDQAWSPTLTGSARVGAQIYESDRTNKTSPYVEASLNYALSRKSNLRWYNQLGFDGSQLGNYDARYAFHTGVTLTNQITEKLAVNAGVNYVHSDYRGNSTVSSAKEDEFNASLGVSYKLWKNLSLQANYSFTTISSDITLNEFDRHYTTVGLNASF
jgi:hypothetical protein